MLLSIFNFGDYKRYLKSISGTEGKRTGFRSSVAEAAGCNTTYVSQVLNGDRDFSLEQAERLNAFLNHTPEEGHYFLLLIQKARAGTQSLRSYFEKQIETIKEQRESIQGRIKTGKKISQEHQSVYYSTWYFAAVHVALSIPELQTPTALSNYFGLSLVKVRSTLDFLKAADLAIEKNGKYFIGPSHIHLGNESENIKKHHTNWRLQALTSLDEPAENDIHYSAAVSISKLDIKKIKEQLLGVVKNSVDLIENSKEEEVFVFGLDFFHLKR